MISVLLLYGN